MDGALGDQVADTAAGRDYQFMAATATATAPGPEPAHKAGSAPTQDSAVQVQTEDDEALSFADAALERVTSSLNEAADDLKKIMQSAASDDPAQCHDAEQALAQIEPINAFLKRIRGRGRNQNPDDALAALTQTSALASDIEIAHDRSPASDSPPNGPPPHRKPLRHLWYVVLANVRKALPHLWAFISRLFTPTQWTVAGNVSTGLFGFASASLSVTFGSSD